MSWMVRRQTDGWMEKMKELGDRDKTERQRKRDTDRGGQGDSVFWCLTLPEGRLQFSRAVSTRFLSAENILKILRGTQKHNPYE